jgi:hypothetical protein
MQLRERAIDLGEKGGRFLGMNPQQVDTVVEFASNLRRGLVQLPLNDRSKELLAEISALKSEKEVQRVAIARLEREISTRESPSEGESNVLKQLLDTMVSENQKLKGDMAKLKAGGAIDHESSVLTPLMRERVKEILGEDLVLMPPSAEVQFICAINAYDKISQELSSTKKLLEKQSYENGATEIGSKSKPPFINSPRDSDISVNSKTTKNVGGRLAEASNDTISSAEKSEVDLSSKANSDFGPGHADEKKVAGLRETGLRKVVGLREEHMVTTDDLVNRLTSKCNSLEDELTAVKKERQKDQFMEIKCLCDALDQAKQKLSLYIGEVKNLHLAVLSVEESRIDSTKARKQIACLNDIIREKSRLYDALAARITKEGVGKKKISSLSRVRVREHKSNRGNRENESDCSTSTNSIDRSISRAVSSSGRCSPSLKQKMQKHLEDSLRLISEKDNVIREQAQKTVELTSKLLLADESFQKLQKEADRMKTDSKYKNS